MIQGFPVPLPGGKAFLTAGKSGPALAYRTGMVLVHGDVMIKAIGVAGSSFSKQESGLLRDS